MKLISIAEASKILELSPKILRRLVLKNKFDFLYVNGIKKYNYDCIINLSSYEKKKRNYWTKEKCAEEALKYKTQAEWAKNNSASHSQAYDRGWMEECCIHMDKVISWTPELVLNEVKKYKRIGTFTKKCSGGYKAMIRFGLLEECRKYFEEAKKPNGYWTSGKCIENAKKYNTISEWINNDAVAYQNARKNGSFEKCIKHMTKLEFKSKPKWTLEKCKEDALNYNTITEWNKLGRKSYRVAQKNNWLEECTTHMKKRNNHE